MNILKIILKSKKKYTIIISLATIALFFGVLGSEADAFTKARMVRDLFVYQEPDSPTNCITPDPNNLPLQVTSDTILCNGEYQLLNSMDKFITIESSDVTLDCDGAKLIGAPFGSGIFIENDYNNITIKNCTLENFWTAIGVYTTAPENHITNIKIENINFSDDSKNPLFLINVYNSEITNITRHSTGIMTVDKYATIRLEASSNNLIHHNQLLNYLGISISKNSNNNLIYSNNIGDMSITNFSNAINIDGASNSNEIYFNNIYDIPGAYGIIVGTIVGSGAPGGAHSNIIRDNKISNSKYGVIIYSDSTNNTFLRNNFVDNIIYQASDSGSGNVFNNGTEGNFWSDFDEPSEGCVDLDINGVCDSPYMGIVGSAGTTDTNALTGAPIIDPIPPIEINELNNAIIIINATDPNGDQLTYSIDDPRFNSLEGCWPGRHAFLWTPDEYGAGSYAFNAIVSDGIHEVSQPVSVIVNNTCQINKWGQMVCTSGHETLRCY